MHEIGMCESVLAAIERRAQGRPVEAVTVRVGTLLRVVPEAFTQAFELVATGGVADGATPDLVFVPVQGRCQDCDQAFESDEPTPACPACGSVRVARDGGDDLMLESIRYRPTAPVEG
ncbi:hydrogenase maturation nickel metallochaperone HypA [soil metagenome]